MTTREGVLHLAKELSNAGRWGDDDQVGTLNLITPEARREATREVMTGEVHSLAIAFEEGGPQRQVRGRFNPVHLMIRDGGDALSGALNRWYGGEATEMRALDDILIMPLQGATHWDGLGHVLHDERMYNGFGAEMVSSFGAERNGIEQIADRVFGRGVLLDVPRHLGREWLNPGEAIHAELLDAVAQSQGVEIRSGDVLLVRTGQVGRALAEGDWGELAGGPGPGLSLDTLPWLFERQIAAVGADNFAVEVLPHEVAMPYPFHLVAIPNMGLTLGELFALEGLADACAADGRYGFLFAAPPLPITGAVGSPINPLAIR